MKTYERWAWMGLALGCLTACETARALRIDFINGAQSFVILRGEEVPRGIGTIRFPGSDGMPIVSIASDGVGDGNGLGGRMAGLFTIGPLTIQGDRQFAPVTGRGDIRLFDYSGSTLTAVFELAGIGTFPPEDAAHARGTMNPSAVVNLTSIRYVGANQDMTTLAGAGAAILTLDFAYTPFRDLRRMTEPGALTTIGFSGSIVAVPEPSGLAWLGIGWLGLLYSARTARRGRSTKSATHGYGCRVSAQTGERE